MYKRLAKVEVIINTYNSSRYSLSSYSIAFKIQMKLFEQILYNKI